ncbi:iron ABC transporter permease [Flavobacterium pallidum]|uniref:Iron ABC transporter n=1 Tax=Flavobacterium pallidum TaxID=2172098 RepID=A0A2S1SHE1_9FLAO|nr:iron ABC transporter permease [Flavobacterium pallidum]AWI25828.1 iron ABC transporter [Flavobacterium pallidum]
MHRSKRHITLFLLLFGVTILFFLLDISFGPLKIPVQDVFRSLAGKKASKDTWEFIILNYRLPKAITAMLVGMGLSVSGLLMQTLFRNPLAGPDVLGLSSGSGLGVAFVIMGAGMLPGAVSMFLISSYGVILASCLGSFAVLMTLLFVARKLRDTSATLIVGLMFGSFSSAIVGVLTYFSTAEQLQKYTFWALGNLGNLSWISISILATAILLGLVLSIASVKSLNAMLLGDNYARSLGMDLKKSRLLIIFSTSILAGSITAFAGPIAFIGLAVPHMAKLVFQTSEHRILFGATLLCGAIIMLLCDMLCQFPGSETVLPINAITSIIGAPMVIWLVMRKRKIIN